MIFLVEVLDKKRSEPKEGVTVWITFDGLISSAQRHEKTDRQGIARFDLSPHRPGVHAKISIGYDDVYEGTIQPGTKTFFV